LSALAQACRTIRAIPIFMQIRDDLADKGFFTATAEELITWARTGSLMWMTFGLACCAVEMMQMSMPRYDAALRICASGVAPTVRRHHRSGDAYQQNGTALSQDLRSDARTTLRHFDGLLRDGGGYYHYSYSVVRGCDRIVPVDIYVNRPGFAGGSNS
jgi:NADH-quinone oxidoreductase subunit B